MEIMDNEIVNNADEKNPDSLSVWKRVRYAYVLFSLIEGLRLLVYWSNLHFAEDSLMLLGIVLSVICPLCLMGWLRKHCHWIFAVLICVLADQCHFTIGKLAFDYTNQAVGQNAGWDAAWTASYHQWSMIIFILLLFSFNSVRKAIYNLPHSESVFVRVPVRLICLIGIAYTVLIVLAMSIRVGVD